MYKCLLVLASAAALKRPQRGLAVRGGELGLNAETAINVGTGLMGVAGAYTVIDPAGNIEKYGISKPDASAVNMMAWAGGWQVALAAIYAADAEKAVGISGYIAAWTLLAQSRVSDVMGGPKASTYIWTAICAALGYKTLRDDLSPWPLVAVWTLNGVQQHFMRDQCLEMYGSVWKSTSASGAPDNSSPSLFSTMTRPCWLRRVVRNRHRHAVEQASRRWRGGHD